jgi:CRISPR/Cas system-associated protein Cas5 (RAMP superfamily)
MELKDYSTTKLKNEMKYWIKQTGIFAAVGVIGLALTFALAGTGLGLLQGVAFLAGGSCSAISLIYTLPNYFEEKKKLKKHYKYLVENKDNLKYTDNQFEIIYTDEEKREMDSISKIKKEFDSAEAKEIVVKKVAKTEPEATDILTK